MAHEVSYTEVRSIFPATIKKVLAKRGFTSSRRQPQAFTWAYVWDEIDPTVLDKRNIQERLGKRLETFKVRLQATLPASADHRQQTWSAVIEEEPQNVPWEGGPLDPVSDDEPPRHIPEEAEKYVRERYTRCETHQLQMYRILEGLTWYRIECGKGLCVAAAPTAAKAITFFRNEYGRSAEPYKVIWESEEAGEFPNGTLGMSGGAFWYIPAEGRGFLMNSQTCKPSLPMAAQMLMHPDDGGFNWDTPSGDTSRLETFIANNTPRS